MMYDDTLQIGLSPVQNGYQVTRWRHQPESDGTFSTAPGATKTRQSEARVVSTKGPPTVTTVMALGSCIVWTTQRSPPQSKDWWHCRLKRTWRRPFRISMQQNATWGDWRVSDMVFSGAWQMNRYDGWGVEFGKGSYDHYHHFHTSALSILSIEITLRLCAYFVSIYGISNYMHCAFLVWCTDIKSQKRLSQIGKCSWFDVRILSLPFKNYTTVRNNPELYKQVFTFCGWGRCFFVGSPWNTLIGLDPRPLRHCWRRSSATVATWRPKSHKGILHV